MKWVGKAISGVGTGIVAAILAAFVVGMAIGGGAGGGKAGAWAMLIGFGTVLLSALMAQTGKRAWGRGSLICALLSFALPLSGFLLSRIVGAQAVGQAQTDAEQVGAAIGAGLGGMFLTGTLAVVGFFLGLIFLVMAFFLLRGDGHAKAA
jgi:hypothetical protein